MPIVDFYRRRSCFVLEKLSLWMCHCTRIHKNFESEYGRIEHSFLIITTVLEKPPQRFRRALGHTSRNPAVQYGRKKFIHHLKPKPEHFYYKVKRFNNYMLLINTTT